jgi:hypothetical protein
MSERFLRVAQHPSRSFALRVSEGRVREAAFSLGTFFVAVDKESTSPAGARTRCQKCFRLRTEEKTKKLDPRLRGDDNMVGNAHPAAPYLIKLQTGIHPISPLSTTKSSANQ